MEAFDGGIGVIPVSNGSGPVNADGTFAGNGGWFAAAIPKLDDVHLETSRLMEEDL